MLTSPDSAVGFNRLRLVKMVKRGDRQAALDVLTSLEAGAVDDRAGLDRRVQLKAALEAQDEHGDGTALVWAASHGFDSLVERLLAAGASVNAKATNNGMTALHVASDRGRITLVRYLIKPFY